ncbi:MAG: response regulator transcription factor [Pseudomonadota bacterium]
MTDVIDVVLGDSNPLVLTALSEVFEQDPRFSVVATSATAEGLLGTVMRVPVSVGVIDWSLPAIGGAKLLEILREQAHAPRIVVYGDESGDLPKLAMTYGAAGFAPRTDNVEALLEVCVDVAAGKMVFPFIDVRVLQQDPIQSLSKKERAILEALSTGLTNRELAAELDISINTVKFHLSNLYDKLSVKNRAQAIAFFLGSSRQIGLSDQD